MLFWRAGGGSTDARAFPYAGDTPYMHQKDFAMSPTSSMFVPRNLSGGIVRLTPTPDGGAEVVAWNAGAWQPADIAVGDVLAAPVASDARLAELGIPDPEEAEDRAIAKLTEKLEARRRKPEATAAAPSKKRTEAEIEHLLETFTDPEETEDRAYDRAFARLRARRTQRRKPANDA